MSRVDSPSNSIKQEGDSDEAQVATQILGDSPEEEIQVLPAIEVVTARTRSNTARSYYQSQPSVTPPEFQDLPDDPPAPPPEDPDLPDIPQAPPRVPRRRMATRGPPVLNRAGEIATVDEIVAYGDAVEQYVGHGAHFLSQLGEDQLIITDEIPHRPDDRNSPLAEWLTHLHNMTTLAHRWDTVITAVREEAVRAKTASRRSATPAASSSSRRKFPLPGKYNGSLGDAATTFLVQCQNYFITEGANWQGNYKIRWALQFLEEKAGPWAMQQLKRMETDRDDDGDLPDELEIWAAFVDFFKTQFVDAGAVIQAKKKWRQAIVQTGSAKDYFALMEPLIIKLGYDRDMEHVIDQIFLGLKAHIRGHFATMVWSSFQEMKESVVAYDEATFNLGPRREGKKDFKGKVKKTPRAEASAVGTKRLTDQEWEMCKVKGYCFICKKNGKEILGLAREHPNHPARDKKEETTKTTQKYDKKKSTKRTAGVRATESKDMDSDVDNKTAVMDSDSDDQPEGSKN
jgi:hypothetical protein